MSHFNLPNFPSIWTMASIGQIANIVYGKSLRAEERDNDGGIPVYGSNGVVGKHNSALHPGPSIVIGRKGTAGAVHYVPEAFWCIDTTYYLDNISDFVDVEFLAYILRLLNLPRLSMTVGVPGINRHDLANERIPLPPLPEQRRIADILRGVDSLRQSRRDANDRLERLLPSIFLDMFGDASTWKKTVPLKDLVNFVGGGTPSRQVKRYFTGDIPWATSKDIKQRYLFDAQEHITEEGISNSATNLTPANTILIVVKSKILMHSLPIGITTRPFCFGQDIKGLICKSDVVPQFITEAMLVQTDYILKQARGVNTEGLTLDILRAIPIPDIDIERQQEFLSRISIYDDLVDYYASSNSRLDDLFFSIINRGFTGDLTASWREANKIDLQHAAVKRDVALGIRTKEPLLGDFRFGRITQDEADSFRETLMPFAASAARSVANISPSLLNLAQYLNEQYDFSMFADISRKMLLYYQDTVSELMTNAIGQLSQSMRLSLASLYEPLKVSISAPLVEVFQQTTNYHLALARDMSQIAVDMIKQLDSVTPLQVNRIVHEDLDDDEQTYQILRILSLGKNSAKSYYRPEDLSDDVTHSVQAEASLHLLEALGFVRQVELDGKLYFRLIDEHFEVISKPDELFL